MYASISASDFRPMTDIPWAWVDVPVGDGTVRGITVVNYPEWFYVRLDVPDEANNATATFFVRPVDGRAVTLQTRSVTARGVTVNGTPAVVTGTHSLPVDTSRGEATYLTCLLDAGDVLMGVRMTYDPAPGEFVPITPRRVLDSTIETGVQQSLTLPVPLGQGVHAVHINVTVTDTQGAGYLTVSHGGHQRPATSNVAWGGAGQTSAVGTTVGVVNSGTIGIYQGGQSGISRLIVDLTGYYRV